MKAIEVPLSWYDVLQASLAGVCRYMKNVEKDSDQRYGEVATNRWATDIEGCLGELVLSKFLGIYWDGAYRAKAKPGDVGPFEARQTIRTSGHLILHKGDDDHRIFVLVTGAPEGRAPYIFRVAGWIRAGEGKREEWWGELHPGNGRPSFNVPQRALGSPLDLHDLYLTQATIAGVAA